MICRMIYENRPFTRLAIATLLALTACKSDDKNTSPTTATLSELIDDPQLTSALVNGSHGEALSAAVDQSVTGASKYLLKMDDDDDNDNNDDSSNDSSNVSKVCSASSEDKTAVVEVTSQINRSRTKTSRGGTVTISRKRTGTSSMTRTWSNSDGTPVTCNGAKTAAAVDFENPSGLKLAVSYSKNRSSSLEFRGPKNSFESKRTVTATGTRQITWQSNDASDDTSTTYIRNKTVTVENSNHRFTMTNKNGRSIESTVSMKTVDNKPLQVKMERRKDNHTVVSKTFVSGQLSVERDDGSSMLIVYDNLKLDVTSEDCKPVSGVAQIEFNDASGSIIKTLTLESDDDGNTILKTSGGDEIEEFDLDGCDPEDTRL